MGDISCDVGILNSGSDSDSANIGSDYSQSFTDDQFITFSASDAGCAVGCLYEYEW